MFGPEIVGFVKIAIAAIALLLVFAYAMGWIGGDSSPKAAPAHAPATYQHPSPTTVPLADPLTQAVLDSMDADARVRRLASVPHIAASIGRHAADAYKAGQVGAFTAPSDAPAPAPAPAPVPKSPPAP